MTIKKFFFNQKINLYIYNLGLKQNIIVTLDDYLLSWRLRNCFSKKKMYKYNLGLKKLLVTLDGSGGGIGGGSGGSGGGGSGCGGCDCCLL